MKKFAITRKNPFKFGTVVDGVYFTDREKELASINELLNSPNHLILISPRRFGKTSLVRKLINSKNRKYVFIDLQLINSVEDFAAQYLKRIYTIFPSEKIRNFVKNFRIVPGMTLNPVNNTIDFSFQPGFDNHPLLEDVLNLPEKLSSEKNRLIAVLDEFQEIKRIDKDLERILRSIMQYHKNINYIFLGSQESMMREIFEKKKSSFYHFGQLLYLKKIEKNQFKNFISGRLTDICQNPGELTDEILSFTKGHPYYTQQLAYHTWNLLSQKCQEESVVKIAVKEIIHIHDFDYERLWINFNSTDKKILTGLTFQNESPLSSESAGKINIKAPSTIFSSLKRLMERGYVIKTGNVYEIDDPFFSNWIIYRRQSD